MKGKHSIKNISFKKITQDSRLVTKGDLFVAVQGEHYDGHDYIEAAVKRGAACCLVEKKLWGRRQNAVCGVPVISVDDTRYELSRLTSAYYGHPSSRMNIIGITGTNGKTTVSFLVDRLLTDSGFKTGIIGTIFYKVGKTRTNAKRTTPDALMTQGFLAQMVKVKTDYAVLEISSHAISQERVRHVYYDIALFTNLSQEHLDYHENMKGYFNVKSRMFKNLKKSGVAVVNRDDARGDALLKKIHGRKITFGISKKAHICAKNIKANINGSSFDAIIPKGVLKIKTRLIGKHNISNILAAIAIGYICGLDADKMESSIKKFRGPRGRLEEIAAGRNYKIFVDYAHTKDALLKVLNSLRPYVKNRLITVFGCGGDRDRSKRPSMGSVSGRLSDFTVLTNDNPRSENPEDILKEIEKGIEKKTKKYSIIPDRKKAIALALIMARKGDVVLIAGKGHVSRQTIGDKSIHFDDCQIVRKLLGV